MQKEKEPEKKDKRMNQNLYRILLIINLFIVISIVILTILEVGFDNCRDCPTCSCVRSDAYFKTIAIGDFLTPIYQIACFPILLVEIIFIIKWKASKIKKVVLILTTPLLYLGIMFVIGQLQDGYNSSMEIDKPVLYLYPKEDMNVTINFEKEDNLLVTYPKFQQEWKVFAKKDGSLYDEKGNYYYALYWDEKQRKTVDFQEGFYVTSDNAISFLEDKLTYIGLNDRERNEFIMYWLPILEKNKKSVVYFELTKERQQENKIYIHPVPDSLLRVTIHVKKINQKIKIKEQQLEKFNRHGFSAIEWGGTSY